MKRVTHALLQALIALGEAVASMRCGRITFECLQIPSATKLYGGAGTYACWVHLVVSKVEGHAAHWCQ